MSTIRKILAPTDLSECSREALREAGKLAGRFDATIDVLHVWEYPAFWGEAMLSPYSEQTGSLLNLAESTAKKRFEQFVAAVEKEDGVKIGRKLISAGVPEQVVVETAEKDGYDMVVMGTHGRKGVARFFMGSVAERVVRGAHCPVLTVRLRDEESTDSE